MNPGDPYKLGSWYQIDDGDLGFQMHILNVRKSHSELTAASLRGRGNAVAGLLGYRSA